MMDSLRRYVWVVDLIGIAIGAVLAGHATATFLAARLPQQPTPISRAPTQRGHAVADPGKSIDAIVDRDVFCSTCSDAPVVERTRRALRLLAIMFARPPDSRWSVAVVRDDAAATTGPYGVGAQLGEVRIAAIDEVRVILDDRHGHYEVLDLLPRRPGDRLTGERDTTFEGVRRLGTHRYEVRRDALDRFLQGGVAPPWPRIVPQMRDGQASGLLLAGVRSDSAFAALGLTSGDLLVEVNGRAIATPDAALAAYAALRTAEHVSLVVERDGRRIRLDYVIR